MNVDIPRRIKWRRPFAIAFTGSLLLGSTVALRSEPASGRPEGALVDIPGAIQEYAGVTFEEVQVATENQTSQRAHACMAMAGWTYPDYEPRTAPDPVIRVPVAEMYLRQLDSSETVETEDPDRSTAERACWTQAIKSVQNPMDAILAWVDAQTPGIYDAVGADRRVIAAHLAERRCIQDAGYPSIEVGEQRLEGSAAAVAERVGSGDLDLSTARSELAAIATQERALWAATDRCRDPAMEVERSVAIEAESAWLSAHLESLHTQIDLYRADIEGMVGS